MGHDDGRRFHARQYGLGYWGRWTLALHDRQPGRVMAVHVNIGQGPQRGQSLVEFALILPVILLLTLGIVDAARVFTSWIALNGGVSEASLYASNSVKVTHWCMKPADAPTG